MSNQVNLMNKVSSIEASPIGIYRDWRCNWYRIIYGIRQNIAGPSILFIYLIIGVMVFCARLVNYFFQILPINHLFHRFNWPMGGLLCGMDILGITIGIADLSAIIYYLQFMVYLSRLSKGQWLVLLRFYGFKPTDSTFIWWVRVLVIKILAIIILIAVGLWMIALRLVRVRLLHLLICGRILPNRCAWLLGWFPDCNLFGVELVGTTAAETKDPARQKQLTPFQFVSLFSMCWHCDVCNAVEQNWSCD